MARWVRNCLNVGLLLPPFRFFTIMLNIGILVSIFIVPLCSYV